MSDKICTALNPWRPEEGNVMLTPMEAFHHILTFFHRAQERIVELERERPATEAHVAGVALGPQGPMERMSPEVRQRFILGDWGSAKQITNGPAPGICQHPTCGLDFLPRVYNQKYCTPACRQRAAGLRHYRKTRKAKRRQARRERP